MASQFNDLSEFFKSGLSFQDLYKIKNFGSTLLPENKAQRVEDLSKHRREARGNALLKRRKISASKLSPYVTPHKKTTTTKEKQPLVEKPVQKDMEERLVKLKQWQQMKLAKKKLENQKRKPPFKVGLASNVPHDNFGRAKSPVNQSTSVSHSVTTAKIAKPLTRHKKASPKGKKEKTAPIKINSENDVTEKRTHGYGTRSQKHLAVLKDTEVTRKNTRVKQGSSLSNKSVSVKNKDERAKTSNVSADTAKTIETKKTPVKNERPVLAEITPAKNSAPVYISPFITVARGKDSARKEFQQRRSQQSNELNTDIVTYGSPKAGAAYFLYVLNENVDRIQAMCKEWAEYKETASPPEGACDMINVAIGQSQLLINKKFEQFRGLIKRCENKDPDAPVTCEDLHGFWDMVYIQVVNLDKRFENLKQLKENNWEEIIPEKKIIVKSKVAKKKTTKPNSNLRNIIKAARELKKEQNSEEVKAFDAVSFSVISPARNQQEARKTPRRSARKSLLNTATELNRSKDSPGLKMLRASMNIKQIVEGKTPTRSILKSDSCHTQEKKTVLFQDEVERESDVENDSVFIDASDKTPRRSKRLNRCASKLF